MQVAIMDFDGLDRGMNDAVNHMLEEDDQSYKYMFDFRTHLTLVQDDALAKNGLTRQLHDVLLPHWSVEKGALRSLGAFAKQSASTYICVALAIYACDPVTFKTFYIKHLFVNTKYRRRTYGRALYRRLEKIARRRTGVTHMFIESTTDSIGFWTKMGFEPRKYNDEGQLEMEKSLVAVDETTLP